VSLKSSEQDIIADLTTKKDPRSHKRHKHVLRCYHLIREIISQGDVRVCKVHMDHNVVDPMMKSLPQPKHEAHMWSMGIRYLLY
jgi:hypothetical protein